MAKKQGSISVLDVLKRAKKEPDHPGPTTREVAAELGISLGSAQGRLHAAALRGEVRVVSGHTVSPVTGIRHQTWFYLAADEAE